MLGQPVDRPTVLETTALGAAYLAGLRLGWYRDLVEIASLWHCEQHFAPRMEEGERERLYRGWLEAWNGSRAAPEGLQNGEDSVVYASVAGAESPVIASRQDHSSVG